jgi:hypothetical protein
MDSSPLPAGVGGFRPLLLTLLVILGTSVVAAPAAAAEDPRFEANVQAPQLQPGVEQTVTVSLENDAADADDRVETATAVEVLPKRGATPIEVRSGPIRVGTLADGRPADVPVRLVVPADAPGGTYQLPLTVVYEYEGDERERTTVHATVEIPRRPIFAVETAAVDLHPRETGTVTLAVGNVGSQPANVTTATVQAPGGALTVGSTTAFLGALAPGDTTSVAVPITATRAATGGPHDLAITPQYVDENGVQQTAPRRTVGVALAAAPRFGVVERRGTVSPGESGTIEWTLENRGDSTVSDVVLQLEPQGSAVLLDGDGPTTRHVERWAPGDERTVSLSVQAAESARNGSHPLRATVRYTHAAGLQVESGPYDLGVPVTAVENVAVSALALSHAGPQVLVTGAVTYRGSEPVEDAVFVFHSRTDGVTVREGQTAVGRLEPGETVQVSGTIGTDGDRVPVTLAGQLQYAADGDRRLSEPQPVRVQAAPRESLLAVEPVNATLGIDQSNVLRVAVENVGPVALSDVRAQLAVAAPYESQTPTAFVPSLAPGESTVLQFEVTTPEDGVATGGAFSLNVSAATPGDRTVVDGPHLVPFTVGEDGATGTALPIAVLAVVVIALLGGGWWWLNRS